MYLIFETKEQAEEANSIISSNMNCNRVGVNAKTGVEQPERQNTVSWAVPQQDKNNKWFFEKPENTYMQNVFNYDIVMNVELVKIEDV